jgi:hypothetical protein
LTWPLGPASLPTNVARKVVHAETCASQPYRHSDSNQLLGSLARLAAATLR